MVWPIVVERSSHTSEREFLFVCGCPRSGTTALALWLNRHPDICVGIERYSTLFLQASNQATPSLFDHERFASIQTGDTFYNELMPEMRSVGLPERIRSARLVGDKIPTLFRRYGLVAERFPGARIVFIVRNPVWVASSYKARLNDPNDNWPHNVSTAIREWNDSIRLTEHFRGRLNIGLVDYHQTIERGAGLTELADFLGVDPAPLVDHVPSILARGAMLKAERVSMLTPEEEALVVASADYGALRRLGLSNVESV